MSRVEDDLREAFRRREELITDTTSLRSNINSAYVRAKRRRRLRRSLTAVTLAVAVAALPLGLNRFRSVAAPAPATTAPADGGAPSPSEEPAPAGPFDVLLIDTGQNGALQQLSLLHLPADRSRPYLIDFPLASVIAEYSNLPTFRDVLRHSGAAQLAKSWASVTRITPDLTVTYTPQLLRVLTAAVGSFKACSTSSASPFPKGCFVVDAQNFDQLLTMSRTSWESTMSPKITRGLGDALAAAGLPADPVRVHRYLRGAGPVAVDGDVVALQSVVAGLKSYDVHAVRAGHDFISASYGVNSLWDLQTLLMAIQDDTLAAWTAAHRSADVPVG